MPVTEIDRANMIFERIHYLGQPEQAQQPPREQALSKAREARERQAATQVEQDQRPQEHTPVTPPVGQRQEVEPRISVGTRLARYRAQLDLVQRREPDDE